MIPVGYMYKTVREKPDWLETDQVLDIYSVSSCISEDFDDWINYWKHNGYWFFDTPQLIEQLAAANRVDLSGMSLFFYTVYEFQWNDKTNQWEEFKPEQSFQTNVLTPKKATSQGFDVTSFSSQSSAECSPLSCNNLARDIKVTNHCLFSHFDDAKRMLESGGFDQCEPGPYRIFEVYRVENIPNKNSKR
ncbi:MAG: hypothetical protein COB51_06895 [Moraxellaceae bacterium]|nr:MAG: hypothetical protein COB51_06895 [Moraxellaceae bacterium]